jgi:hypothetical protein
MDLVSLRHTEDPERVDLKAIVKQATKSKSQPSSFSEEAFLFAKYLRNEKRHWFLELLVLHQKFPRTGDISRNPYK